MSNSRIHEQLEAYRPGVDSLQAEEFSDLRSALANDATCQIRLAAVEQRDAAVRTAMHSVPVPADLADRLLARLASAPGVEATVSLPAIEKVPHSTSTTRRRIGMTLGACLAAVAAATLGIVVFRGDNDSLQPLTKHDLGLLAQQWAAEPALRDSEYWKAAPAAGLASHPLIAKDVKVAAARYQRLITDAGVVIAYELKTPQGRTAWLFVHATKQPCEVDASPLTRLPATGQNIAGAWQRGEFVYVLVVDQREATLQDFVHIPRHA